MWIIAKKYVVHPVGDRAECILYFYIFFVFKQLVGGDPLIFLQIGQFHGILFYLYLSFFKLGNTRCILYY